MYQSSAQASDTARLEDYLRAIQLRKWMVLACAVLGLGAGLLITSSLTSNYTATASVIVGPTPVGSLSTDRLNAPNLEREREILQSNPTARQALIELETNNPATEDTEKTILAGLDVAFRPDSDVLSVSYVSTDPERSALLADAVAAAYVNARETAATDFYRAAIDAATEQIDTLARFSSQKQRELNALLAERAQTLIDVEPGDSRNQTIDQIDNATAEVRAELSNAGEQTRELEADLRAARNASATRVQSAAVLRSAAIPSAPDGPSRNLIVLGMLLVGLASGIVGAFLAERLDKTAKDDADVALALGTNVIGSLPTLGLGYRNGPSALVMMSQGGSSRLAASREAYRRLRSSVQFLRADQGARRILVTSASPAEGKSVTSANLAISLAQNGESVALVNADMRRPSQETLFGLETAAGLSEFLGSDSEINASPASDLEGLWIVQAGAAPANPGELLGSQRFETLLEDLSKEVAYIIIDSPPILSTADALAAARFVDGVVVVVDTRKTETSDLLQVRSDLERSGSTILGAVMNRRRFSRGGLLSRRKYAYYRTGNDS